MQEDRFPEQLRGFEMPGSGPILPSRGLALSGLAEVWAAGASDIRFLTGAPGSGKSWLWRMAVEKTRAVRSDLRWVWCPHWPGAKPSDLIRALMSAIEESGIHERMSLERMYVRAERRIREFREDGYGLRIVVEEAHHLGFDGFESIRILTERLRPVGIDLSVLFVGRTTLVSKIRKVTGESRPSGWHLTHISLPETLELLKWFGGAEKSWTRAEADWIHREALGNPRRIIRWAETVPGSPKESDKPTIKPGFGYEASGWSPAASRVSLLSEPLIPTRPPLAEGEGVIEVGYEDDDLPAHGVFEIGASGDSQYIHGEVPDADTAEFTSKTTRYRLEAGESFAPYGLGSNRNEAAPESPLD